LSLTCQIPVPKTKEQEIAKIYQEYNRSTPWLDMFNDASKKALYYKTQKKLKQVLLEELKVNATAYGKLYDQGQKYKYSKKKKEIKLWENFRDNNEEQLVKEWNKTVDEARYLQKKEIFILLDLELHWVDIRMKLNQYKGEIERQLQDTERGTEKKSKTNILPSRPRIKRKLWKSEKWVYVASAFILTLATIIAIIVVKRKRETQETQQNLLSSTIQDKKSISSTNEGITPRSNTVTILAETTTRILTVTFSNTVIMIESDNNEQMSSEITIAIIAGSVLFAVLLIGIALFIIMIVISKQKSHSPDVMVKQRLSDNYEISPPDYYQPLQMSLFEWQSNSRDSRTTF
ncbi:unnamed protein product, partial [Didymodactylos carnosus]